MIEGRLTEAEHAFQEALEQDVAAFNRRMEGRLEPTRDPGATKTVS
jgi:hypothetical protein